MLAGLGAIALGLRADAGGTGLAGCRGESRALLVALARPLPRVVGWLLAAATGLALALDSPPEAISLARRQPDAARHRARRGIVLLVSLLQVTSRLHRAWQRIGARIVGSWIAASAILVLALRLVR